MGIRGKHVYVLVQEPYEYSERAVVELYSDAVEAIAAARPRCDETRTRLLSAQDYDAGIVFRGRTPQNDAEVTVTRQAIA